MVLIDELSASGGDSFSGHGQDNKRGILYGYRTMGRGSVFGTGAALIQATTIAKLDGRQNDVVTRTIRPRRTSSIDVRPTLNRTI
jgi:hypothetical protein